MKELGFPFWKISREHEGGLPLVEMNFEFAEPVEAGDEIDVELTPSPDDQGVRFD
jgi:4-hydroxybenzoyl-CoA thioesterase